MSDLATKVEAKAVQTVTGGQDVFSLMQGMKKQILAALPSHLKMEHFLRAAFTAVRKTPKLAECTRESFLGSLLNAAQIGLEPGVLGQCYLIPYGKECQLIIGYQGLLNLVYRSGKISNVYAEIIYEKDEYKVTFGLNRDLIHVPNFDEVDRGKPLFAYAVAKLKDGGEAWVVLPEHEIQKRKNKGQAGNIWREWPDEMRKKTILKYLCKLLPLSIHEMEAIAQDETIKKEISLDMKNAENIDPASIEVEEEENKEA